MSEKGQNRASKTPPLMADLRPLRPVLASAPVLESGHNVGDALGSFGPMLSKKSKIERRQKSRKW
jgi:hypothetical protein